MSINDTLPWWNFCGMPYKDGLPTCDCESRLALAQEEHDDESAN